MFRKDREAEAGAVIMRRLLRCCARKRRPLIKTEKNESSHFSYRFLLLSSMFLLMFLSSSLLRTPEISMSNSRLEPSSMWA